MKRLNEIFLLNQITMDLETEDDGIGRGEEGVLCNGLQSIAGGQLSGESPTVSNYRSVVVAGPDVDCDLASA